MKNFYNTISNSDRIFTLEEINSMSPFEKAKNNLAISYQQSRIGLPTNDELKNNLNAVYVHPYRRQDGTFVRGYWRSKAGQANFEKMHNLSNNQFATQNFVQNNVSTQQKTISIPKVQTPSTQQIPLDTQSNTTKKFNTEKIKYKTIGGLKEVPGTVFPPLKATYNNGRIAAKEINNILNAKYPDARQLMDIALTPSQMRRNTSEYKIVRAWDNEAYYKYYHEKYGLEFEKGSDTLVFNSTSSLAQSICKNADFQEMVQAEKDKGFKNSSFPIEFQQNENLARALHNVTVCNPRIDKDGYFCARVYDIYDFKLEYPEKKLIMQTI